MPSEWWYLEKVVYGTDYEDQGNEKMRVMRPLIWTFGSGLSLVCSTGYPREKYKEEQGNLHTSQIMAPRRSDKKLCS